MSSYLTPIDYLLWVLFMIIEVVLFLKLTANWLKPVKYFMLYAVIRDLILLTLTPKSLNYVYFISQWLGQIISLVWFSYIAKAVIDRLIPTTLKLMKWLPVVITSTLCGITLPYLYNLSLQSIPQLLIMQTHCSLVAVVSIAGAVIFNLNRRYSSMILSIIGLICTGLFTAWAWVYLGYQPLMWEISWIVALLGVAVAANAPQQAIRAPMNQKLFSVGQ
jgi:hypothetical protein